MNCCLWQPARVPRWDVNARAGGGGGGGLRDGDSAFAGANPDPSELLGWHWQAIFSWCCHVPGMWDIHSAACACERANGWGEEEGACAHITHFSHNVKLTPLTWKERCVCQWFENNNTKNCMYALIFFYVVGGSESTEWPETCLWLSVFCMRRFGFMQFNAASVWNRNRVAAVGPVIERAVFLQRLTMEGGLWEESFYIWDKHPVWHVL